MRCEISDLAFAQFAGEDCAHILQPASITDHVAGEGPMAADEGVQDRFG
jgi:hypothetical protein